MKPLGLFVVALALAAVGCRAEPIVMLPGQPACDATLEVGVTYRYWVHPTEYPPVKARLIETHRFQTSEWPRNTNVVGSARDSRTNRLIWTCTATTITE